ALGAQVSTLSPELHDEILAATSHMPHLLAVALAESLPEGAAPYTATGFRDATRMAASGPEVWLPILEQNREAMLAALDRFAERLAGIRAAIAGDDRASLEHHLTRAKQVRDALGS